MTTFVGQGIDRIEARLKVTGKAAYSAEIAVANLAHVVIVGSTIARGRIARIDVSRAERSPGVLAVITHANAPRLGRAAREGGSRTERVLQLLQDDQVLYADQPVALVVADTLDRARGGAALVSVEYRGEAPAVTFDDKSPTIVPQSGGRGPADSTRGDFEGALRASPHRLDATYIIPSENHNPLEMHATIAVWRGRDAVTLYDSTQGIFGVRKRIARVFELDPRNVRVICLYVGGGFGCKGSPWSHVVLATMAARVVGRPTKLVLSRQQMFSLVGHRPFMMQRVSLGADATGKLTAIRHDVVSHTSRFDEFVEPAAMDARGLYACANVRTSHRLVRLDVPTPTFMRAPGEASGSFALESAIDELAHRAKIDPLALRLASYAERDPETDKPFSSKSLRACYQEAAAKFGWGRRSPTLRSMRDGHDLVGWGMATATYPAGFSAASARAELRADGTAVVEAGSQDLGTGTYTIMTQIAADALGVPLARVRFLLGDTALPETPVSGGSRTAGSVGSAVKQAGLAVRRQLVELTIHDPRSPLHGRRIEELATGDGTLWLANDPATRDSFTDILARNDRSRIEARVDAKEPEERKGYSLHSFGAQFVEVRVDQDLGQIRVSRMVGAFAAGRILNAKMARSQLMGGMIWGIGMALHEHTVRDARTGRVVTRDLADYHVPVNADVPAVDVIMIDEEDPHVNAVGAKGMGELGITGVAAAIANAVHHATGVRVYSLPITLDKLIGSAA